MKYLFYVSVIFIFQSTYSQNKDVHELTKLNQEWLNSYHKKDTATLNRIFADDFVLISPKGIKMTKKDIINNLDKQETVSVNIDSIEVRLITGDVGLITAYTTFVLKDGNNNITGQNCYQDVYIKRKGRWFALAAHVTLLNMK
ncbi:MAG: nuclear transport factor 2 family protein [Bacteroidota bacterium]